VKKKSVKVPGGRGLIGKDLDPSSKMERFSMAIAGVSKSDTTLILKIVEKYRKRMEEIAETIDDSEQKEEFEKNYKAYSKNSGINLLICHSKYYPLRLKEMFENKDLSHLIHDIVGINIALDKDKIDWSGDKLFVPRYTDTKKKGAWL